jgi:rhodanese-related sulfurtransferase
MSTKQALIYENLSLMGGALASPHRLKMLQLLTHGEKTVDELAQLTGQSLASASAHMKTLRASNLVVTERRGRSTYCRVRGQRVSDLWLKLRDLGEDILPNVREIMREDFDGDKGLSPLGVLELAERLEKGRIALLDLRPLDEYEQGHIPAARSIPYDVLSEAIANLPRKTPLLVYCRGPFCAAAMGGNDYLREHRFNSHRLRFSVPEWKAAGLPVEST